MDTAKGRERWPRARRSPSYDPPARTLPRILDRIRRDAADAPEDFLRQVEVGYEGE